MMRMVTVLLLVATGQALDWVNTGELAGALTVTDLAFRPGGGLIAAANVDTSSADSGRVFLSDDGLSWTRGGDLPGDVRRLTCLLVSAETLFAGTRATYQGIDSGHVYVSTDRGASWSVRARLSLRRAGQMVTALLEDRTGRIHAGVNYLGMSGYPPCWSADRGVNWSQGEATAYNSYHYRLLQAGDGALYCGSWGSGGLVLKSTDGGASWSATGTMFDAGHATALLEAPGGVIYAGTYPKTNPTEPIGRVFATTDGGATWVEKGYGYLSSTSGIRALCQASDGALYAGSAPSAEVFVSTDGGNTWVSTGSPAGASLVYDLLEVVLGDSSFLYAATRPNGDVFRARIPGGVGLEAFGSGEVRTASWPTVVRRVLRIEDRIPDAGYRAELLDASGRRVMALKPGLNDVSALPPGVYYCRLEPGTTRKFVKAK